MLNIGLWEIGDKVPKRILSSEIDLEKNLEDWIETDPSLIQDGLTIVGRQVKLKAGTADLLAFDSQGRLIIIEIKRGTMYRDIITQVTDYAFCIAEMTPKDKQKIVRSYLEINKKPIREFTNAEELLKTINFEDSSIPPVMIVGSGQTSDLERNVRGYKKINFPITLVSYNVFESSNGKLILVRKLTEADSFTPKDKKTTSAENILQIADKNGIGGDFRKIHKAAIELDLGIRPYKWSIMYTPPQNKTKMLFTIETNRTSKKLIIWFSSSTFSEFYPVSEKEAQNKLGPDGRRLIIGKEVDAFCKGLKQLLEP